VKIYIILMILFGIGYTGVYLVAKTETRQLIGPRFVIWYALNLLGGIILPSAPIYLLFSIILTLATVRGRLDAVCRYIIAAALLPNVMWRASVGSVYICDLDVRDCIAMSLLVYCYVARSTAPPRRGFRIEDGLVLLLFFIFWIAKTRFPSLSGVLRDGVQMTIKLIIPYLLLRNNIRTAAEYRRVLVALALAGAMLALYALYEAMFGWSLFGTIERRMWVGEMLSKSLVQRGGAMRASVTMAGPLMLSFFFLVAIVASFSARDAMRSQLLWIGIVLAGLVGLLTTQSRGNTACLGLAFVIYCLARRKVALAALCTVGAAATALVVIVGARFSPMLASFLNLDTPAPQDGYYDYRGLLLQRGLEEGMKYPWTGTSLEFVYDRLQDITQGQHIVDLVNTYLTIFLMSGFAGLVPLVVLILAVLNKQIVGYRRIMDRDLLTVRAVVITTFVLVLVELTFMSFFDRMPLLLMLVLAGSRLIGFERKLLLRPAQPGNAALPVRHRPVHGRRDVPGGYGTSPARA
jgi:O-antigen ligase